MYMFVVIFYMNVLLDLLICLQPSSGVYTVGDFMTTKEELHVVKPTTTVDEGICYSCINVTKCVMMFSHFLMHQPLCQQLWKFL